MRPVLVVVALVFGQHSSQMPFTVDKKVIEAFAPEGADEPLCESVHLW
jgi:hypothetical protein